MQNKKQQSGPIAPVFMSIILPILLAAFLSPFINSFAQRIPSLNFIPQTNGVVLFCIGAASLYFGWRWYGLGRLGMRNGRPVFAGIGFAFLGWVGLLIARFVSVGIDESGLAANLGITFLFLLIFEAFCVQLWTFGLFFRAMADWQNPLSAAIFSGVLYGFAGFFLFGESFSSNLAILYFVIFGIFYGMIRLRSGSFLGMVFIQAMQSLTVWHLLPPTEPISLPYLFAISCAVFLLVTWRLWPKFTSDFRV